MRVYTKFGMGVVYPFLDCAGVPHFEYISDSEGEVIDKYFTDIGCELEAGRNLANTFHELSEYMQKSYDKQLRALGSQIDLTANLIPDEFRKFISKIFLSLKSKQFYLLVVECFFKCSGTEIICFCLFPTTISTI